MTKELVPKITGNFDFDKRDLVSVAVARAERKIRGAIKLGTEVLDKAEKALADKKDEMTKLSDIQPDKVKKFIAQYKKHIAPLFSGKSEIEWEGTLGNKLGKSEQENIYNITVKTESHKNGRDTLNFPAIRIPLTKAQRLTTKQVFAIITEVRTAEDDLIDAKRKLNDMPTFERQVKAAVVEAQLKGSAEGRKLLTTMEKNFEKTLKLLG